MAVCLEDIKLSLDQIALNVASGCGNCGAAGAPAVSPPARTDDFGTIFSPTGTPPVGYGTWAAYQAKKCDVATWIVDNLKKDIQWMIASDEAALLLSGILAAGLVSFVSGGTVLVILAAYAAVVAYQAAIMQDAEDAITNNYNDLVCSLYGANNATQAITDFENELGSAIDGETVDPVARALLKPMLFSWADTTSINLMFAPAAETALIQIPSGGDCSACGAPVWWQCSSGLVQAHTAKTVDIDSLVAADTNYLAAVGVSGGKNISWTIVGGGLTAPSVWQYQMRDNNQLNCGTGNDGSWEQTWGSHANFSPYVGAWTHQLRSRAFFTVRYSIP